MKYCVAAMKSRMVRRAGMDRDMHFGQVRWRFRESRMCDDLGRGWLAKPVDPSFHEGDDVLNTYLTAFERKRYDSQATPESRLVGLTYACEAAKRKDLIVRLHAPLICTATPTRCEPTFHRSRIAAATCNFLRDRHVR